MTAFVEDWGGGGADMAAEVSGGLMRKRASERESIVAIESRAEQLVSDGCYALPIVSQSDLGMFATGDDRFDVLLFWVGTGSEERCDAVVCMVKVSDDPM